MTLDCITDGNIVWEGQIDFTLQKTEEDQAKKALFLKECGSYFSRHFPAVLEKDGEIIHGHLEPFIETGMEGVMLSISDYTIAGRGSLTPLFNNSASSQYLKIYNNVTNGTSAEPLIQLGDVHDIDVYQNIRLVQVPKNIDPKEWLRRLYSARPVIILPEPK